MGAVSAGGVNKCVAHLTSLTIAEVYAQQRKVRQIGLCRRMKADTPINKNMNKMVARTLEDSWSGALDGIPLPFFSLQDVLNKDFMLLALVSPKLAIWMMNPAVVDHADAGPSFETLIEEAPGGENFDTCPVDTAKSEVFKMAPAGVKEDEEGDASFFLQKFDEQVVQMQTPALLQKGYHNIAKGTKVVGYTAATLLVGGIALFIFGGVIAKVVACVIAAIGLTIGVAVLVGLFQIAKGL
uniref:Transmembrane protein n=1 Tax=Chromera velia CCMP2878 TaxID=1169474 RepID=A0A0G4GYK0_9ALVE|eukprot:Cvel_23937.t1-p1 / transcript=Cvel_23937.t1 / gene=Cvel_23937 / organism=Chromera_velia_CCMP2878 / gene_product=hypothetical protein / transcript_product=hypothetical protein / location=Cvel_scaffold2529:10568-11683(-) / protein_length=239 / sequence_SO=supercontig / SO=protein_coding / is_pseudo=false